MNDLMHHQLVLQVARDRRERFIREAEEARLVRAARGGSSRGRRTGLADAWSRLRGPRRTAELGV